MRRVAHGVWRGQIVPPLSLASTVTLARPTSDYTILAGSYLSKELEPGTTFRSSRSCHTSTGASFKLTVLHADGRILTTVAEGGASFVYSDIIAAHGFAHELDNYGEYSGAPTEGQTYECTKTIIDFTTRSTPNPEGKILVIGSGTANFMNAAAGAKVYESTPPIALFPANE
ncbi:hypothetical protein DFP72DRAFT_1142642 [Ephemerocybe angulata]|uniref:ATP-citrate synthase citrate-binding domain-containing protein n=1 Tax=Ephemerocybe angulata TaxID=980116 RepID=A0A8H6HN26_9AGAR|nr:hypothetical protein DFP72DRAFT_1142642 [Tulosesus angulatus]